jgi:hypothetical protein
LTNAPYWSREPEISAETMRMIDDHSDKIVLPLRDMAQAWSIQNGGAAPV